ncbi:hypothetical protein ACP1KD_004820 [Escherichia coli]
MTSEVKLKTGGDPRSLPDYAALRDEISKLTHPARPAGNYYRSVQPSAKNAPGHATGRP